MIEVRCVNGHMNDATERETKNGCLLLDLPMGSSNNNNRMVYLPGSRSTPSVVVSSRLSYSCIQHLHAATLCTAVRSISTVLRESIVQNHATVVNHATGSLTYLLVGGVGQRQRGKSSKDLHLD